MPNQKPRRCRLRGDLDDRARPRADIQGAGRRNHPARAGSHRALAGAGNHPAAADTHHQEAGSHPAVVVEAEADSHPAVVAEAEAGSHPAAGIHQEAARNHRLHREAVEAGSSHLAEVAADCSLVSLSWRLDQFRIDHDYWTARVHVRQGFCPTINARCWLRRTRRRYRR